MSRCRHLFSPLIVTLGVAVATLGAPARAAAGFTLDFANTANSQIVFDPTNVGANPGSFSFVGAGGGSSFIITNSSGFGTSVGLMGDISGKYIIGPIAGPPAGLQTATVTGSGSTVFSIDDGMGNMFTANVAWIDIFTFGTTGGLNAGGTVNLTNLSYAGTNTDLVAIASNVGGTATISFQFVPAQSLTALTSPGGPQATSFSGSLTVEQGGPTPAPAPAGLVLAVSGLPFLFLGRLLRRRKGSETDAPLAV